MTSFYLPWIARGGIKIHRGLTFVAHGVTGSWGKFNKGNGFGELI
jgi:hypothetical protein